MATAAAPVDACRVRLPTSFKDCRKILRQFGHKGLTINSREDDRLFVLTAPILCERKDQAGFEMRRIARTLVFTYDEFDDEVRVRVLEGWTWEK